MESYIYILLSEDGRSIKVGYTKCVEDRIRDLARIRCADYGEIRLLGYGPGTLRDESLAHRVLKRLSAPLGSEWYILTPDVQAFLDLLSRDWTSVSIGSTTTTTTTATATM